MGVAWVLILPRQGVWGAAPKKRGSGVARRKLESECFHIVLTKKKQRERWISSPQSNVVLQVFNHIGISPSTPGASLISKLKYAIFVLEYFKNNLRSFYNSNVFTFSIGLKTQNSIWIPLFLVNYTLASQTGGMWCSSCPTVCPFVTPGGYTSLIRYSSYTC